ncbi:hypothetical protein NC652_031964 [Populus alba x Populus x berolinensis]|nr:hypothetical protein NC652_031964 [Populus alba x Populus x berolinensis]
MTLILLNAQHQFYELWLNQFVHGVLVNLVLSFLVSTHGFVGAKTADSDKTDLKANLIITDYCMRGMTGCMEEGAQEFLPKPLQLSDVTKLSAI